MAGGGAPRKISASSARAHTRKPKQSSSFNLLRGIFRKILVISLFGILAWAYQAMQPPPTKICGSPEGPPVTAPRIKLRDGRHLAYKEHGVLPRDKATYKIVYVHGFDSCRHDAVVATTLSPDTVEQLGVYIVSFDRPGYGESDPNPKGTVQSIALDIEELADQLGLGSKFYVVGFSLGGQIVWSCLKYIPHRLAGAALLAPFANPWWSGFPANLFKEAFNQLFPEDKWAYRVAHYTPWLNHWWNTKKWLPTLKHAAHSPDVLSRHDKELISKLSGRKNYMAQVRQQGEFESIHRDMTWAVGIWDFDPTDLENPFPDNEGSIHVWQGDEDMLAPVKLQRYIAEQLPWINYHELSGAGHMFPHADGMSDAIIQALLVGKK